MGRVLRAARVAVQARQEALRPARAVVLLDTASHQIQAPASLGGVEVERFFEPGREIVGVPRVDEHRSRQDVRGAGELAQEQRSAPVRAAARVVCLAQDELLRHEVHPVPERRHHHHVGPPVERDQLGTRHRPVHVGDGRMPELREAPVDVGDPHLDLVALRAVVGALEPRGDDDLEQRHAAGAVRILLQKPLESVELLGDPLRVVEPLDPEDQLVLAVALLELGLDRRRLGVAERGPEVGDVDPDRMDPDADRSVVMLDCIEAGLDPEHPQARGAEVARVVARVKADVVGAEHPAQQLGSRRQQAVDLRRGKGDVQEEADCKVGSEPPQLLRHEREMEVVHPDLCLRRGEVGDGLREAQVHAPVDVPRLAREAHAVDEVMEERPDRLVADASVERLLLRIAQEDGHASVLPGQTLRLALELVGHGKPWPAHPGAAPSSAFQRGDEASGARFGPQLLSLKAQSERQAVADDHEI